MEKYDYEELYEIFLNMVGKIEWKVDDSINKNWFLEKKDKFESFGRDIESLLTHIKIAHGRRLYGSEDGKKIINITDINAAIHPIMIDILLFALESFTISSILKTPNFSLNVKNAIFVSAEQLCVSCDDSSATLQCISDT